MVVNGGILDVMQLIAGDADGKKFAKIVVGTSGNPVVGTETALENQVAKDIETFNVLAGGFIQFNSTLQPGDPAMVIREMGLLNDDGILCYRQVITPQNKVTGVTYSINYKIKVQ